MHRRLEDFAFIQAQHCILMFASFVGIFPVDVLGNLSKIHEAGTCDAADFVVGPRESLVEEVGERYTELGIWLLEFFH
jgi:hypothetical protein